MRSFTPIILAVLVLVSISVAFAMNGEDAVKEIGISPDHYDKAGDVVKIMAAHNISIPMPADPNAPVPIWKIGQLHDVVNSTYFFNVTDTTNITMVINGTTLHYEKVVQSQRLVPTMWLVPGTSVTRKQVGQYYMYVALVEINGTEGVVAYDPSWYNLPTSI